MKRLRSTHFVLALFVAGLCVSLAGCPKGGKQPASQAAKNPLAGIQLRLLVVDDPAIAAAAGRLRSEWQARTGSKLVVSEMPAAEFAGLEAIDADAVIYPAALVGQIAERELLAAVPPAILAGQELAWSDLFETLQLSEATWGPATVAVPFGSPVFTCVYRADLLEKLRRTSPETWVEYQALAEFLAHRENLPADFIAADEPWHGTIEPCGPEWAGKLLLARCAAYAKHRDNYSTLFNMNTMQPLIDQPPFVRALEELVAAAKLGPADRTGLDPAAARREILAGHAALALTWPSAAAKSPTAQNSAVTQNPDATKPAGTTATKRTLGFQQLPGSRDVFNFSSKAWEQRGSGDATRVPLLAIDGRVGSVPESAQYPHAAFQLLAWLSGQEWSKTVCAASPATTLFRTSHLAAPTSWTDAALDPAAAKAYARVVQQTLSQPTVLFAVRLPGHDEYLAALNNAVTSTLAGETTAAAALGQTASEWNAITDRLGRESQRRAYQHSLGLEP